MNASIDDIIASDGRNLSAQLMSLREQLFPTAGQKVLAHIGFQGDGAGLSGSSDIPRYSALSGSQRLARELRFAGRRLI